VFFAGCCVYRVRDTVLSVFVAEHSNACKHQCPFGSFRSLFFPRSFLSWAAAEWSGRAAAEGFSLQLPHDHPERTIHLRIEKEVVY